MRLLLFLISLFFCILIAQDVLGQKGCLNLVIEKKLVGKRYSLLFTVKNVGEDVIFEQAALLPWQTKAGIFSSRLVAATNPDTELREENKAIETEKIVALFPRDTMTKTIKLSERFKNTADWHQNNDLLLFWQYKPHQECPQQKGMLSLPVVKRE